DAAESERCAATADRAVEVWLQGDQGDHPDLVRRQAAAQHVADLEPRRVRLLRERESRGRPSALDAGERAADRAVPSSENAHVQRLRRAGGEPVCWHGPAEELLDRE